VTVENPNDFAVEVQSFAPGAAVKVDTAHRAKGCAADNVVVVGKQDLRQRVDGGKAQQFTVDAAVVMLDKAPQACQGASFEITLALAGVSLPD